MSALDEEHRHLALADQHIVDGETRVTEQMLRVEGLRADGHETARAEELLATLDATLAEWNAHRAEILCRIARLTEAAAEEGSAPPRGSRA